MKRRNSRLATNIKPIRVVERVIMPQIALSDLKKEFPFKWRIQSFSKSKAQAICVPYCDARQIEDLLDSVCGPENWQDEYYEVKGNLYCRIGINVNGRWIWKSDCGKETDIEGEKGEASDAFKRTAVKWGAARFLYSMRPYIIKANKKKEDKSERAGVHLYCLDDNGERLPEWAITDYINFKRRSNKAVPAPNPDAKGSEKNDDLVQLEEWAARHEDKTVLGALEILDKGGDLKEYKTEGLASVPRELYPEFCHLVQILRYDDECIEMCLEIYGLNELREVVEQGMTEKILDECKKAVIK